MAVSIYNNLTQNKITQRRKESVEKYVRLILWGRKHPVAFIEKVFKIKLMDFQAYAIEGTWAATSAVWLMCRNSGKSFIGAIYLMTRALLFPQMKIRILASVSRQSQETFTKLEDIAKKNISSLIGSTDVFINEMIKSKADSDGFTHDNNKGWSLELFNGSVIATVKGSAKTAVSLRSNLNFYDEALLVPEEYFATTLPFLAQEKGFKTGVNIDMDILPEDIPNQVIYASSAGDTDSYLWKMYKENAMKMIMGIPGYFAVDISCEVPLHPTINGIPWAPLLTQKKIDDDMRANESKAIREYRNRFTHTGGANSVFRSSDIVRNIEEYFPVHGSAGKDKKYIIAYDPALQNDNSIVLIMEYWQDKATKQWRGKIINMINLMQVQIDGTKHPMRTPDQIEAIRQILVDYNGDNVVPYENVTLYIDAGSGGGGRALSEHLWSDFTDKKGKTWPGVIDLTDEECAAQEDKYPRAKDVIRLIEPRKLRQKMFEAASEMVKEGYIVFPMDMPRTSVIREDDKEITVGEDDFKSFLEFDLLKEEMKAFVKEQTPAGNINYKIPSSSPIKHDDRAYAFVMAAYFISELNRAMLIDNEEKQSGIDEYYKQKQMASNSSYTPSYTKRKNNNPFGDIKSPFEGLRRKL